MGERHPPPHATRRIYCLGCGHTIDTPIDCADRFCKVCAPRRAFRVRNRLTWLFEHHKPQPGYWLKMVTLSMANCKDLEGGVISLVRNFRRLRQRQIWRRLVSGGAVVIEIKGRPGNWHPHLHILCYALWIPWAKLQSAWQEISGGTACYISNVSQDRARYYVTKYITKADVPEFLEYSVGVVLRKFRLFQRFGDWHGVVLPKKFYDYKCPSCSRSDWYYVLPGRCSTKQRSPPGTMSRVVPKLSASDIAWRSPQIWPRLSSMVPRAPGPLSPRSELRSGGRVAPEPT